VGRGSDERDPVRSAGQQAPCPVDRSSAIARRDGAQVIISDLDAAGFLHGNHLLPLVRSKQVGPSTFAIEFYDPECRVEELLMRFTNSESARTCDGIRRIKKVTEKPPARADGRRF